MIGRTTGPNRQAPNVGLTTKDLTLGGQIFPSGYLPPAGGGDGTFDGINRALNREGLPGLPNGGDANDEPSGSGKPTGDQGEADPLKAAGNDNQMRWGTWKGDDWVAYGSYLYIFGDHGHGEIAQFPRSYASKDPIPDDDTPGGTAAPATDGAGHLRPHGDVLGLEGSGLPGQPVDTHGNLANLGKLNEHANLGNSSGVGTQQGAATDPNPDADPSGSGDASQLKQIINNNDPATDPSVQHPLEDTGSAMHGG